MLKEEKVAMGKKGSGNELIKAMEEAVDYMRGNEKGSVTHKIKVPDNINVPKIRKSMNLTPTQFANEFGISYKTVQHWERGDRRPTGPARILLAILEKEPNIVNKYLGSADFVPHRAKSKKLAKKPNIAGKFFTTADKSKKKNQDSEKRSA